MTVKRGAGSMFPAQHKLIELEEVGSTNTEALRLAREGERGPLWVTAKRQVSGKGRSGRRWEDGEGNLFASLLLAPDCGVECAPQLSFVAGLALFDATTQLAADQGIVLGRPRELRLKWPNDGLIGGKKFAGILCESVTRPAGVDHEARLQVVVGMGINLDRCPDYISRPVTSLRAHGINADPKAALGALAQAFEYWLTVWQDASGFAAIRTAWSERAGAIGEPITIHVGGERVSGRYAGIDENGALLMRGADEAVRTFNFGDVTLTGADTLKDN